MSQSLILQTTPTQKAVNALGYLLVWWSAVLGASQGNFYVGAIVAFGMLIWHSISKTLQNEERWFLARMVVYGTLFDTVLSISGLIRYHCSYPVLHFLAPLWISALWLGFAMTVHHSFRGLLSNPFVAVLLGLIGGPLSYFGAERLGAISISQPKIAIPILAISWAVILFLLHRRIQKKEN